MSESLFGAMAKASANAMEGAAIGRSIGEANTRADDAEQKLREWYNHAKELEVTVKKLRADLQHSENQRLLLQEEVNALKSKNEKIESTVDSARQVISRRNTIIDENVKYGKALQRRLQQIEKGLQHSSADTESLTYLLNVYKELFGDFDDLLSKGVIKPGAKEKAEDIWNAFIRGEKLTNNPSIQSSIDQAPMPAKGHHVEI